MQSLEMLQKTNRLPDLSFVRRERLPQRIDQNANFAPDPTA
ncbi:hypothetical protein [Leptolyngbya sp. FACHB-541]|nr:hypothetical protein [Leptolyngbya sp. FACHB-541]